VIPAVQKGSTDLTDADAALLAYIFAQSIKYHFVRNPGSGVHRSAIITIPAALDDNRASSINKLVRINGAQIGIEIKAVRELNGALMSAIMTVPGRYQDFRTNPAEVLQLNFEGERLSLNVPTRYIVLPRVFLSEEIIKLYGNGGYRNLCPLQSCDLGQPRNITGSCLRLGEEVPYSAITRYYMIKPPDSVVYFNGTCYSQKWPANGPTSEPVTDFIAGVQRFFAGDQVAPATPDPDEPVHSAEELMNSVVRNAHDGKSNIVLQAYLYLARIAIHKADFVEAQKDVEMAMRINKRDPDVLETGRFLSFCLAVRSIQSGSPAAKTIVGQIDHELADEPQIVRQQYDGLLNRLKAKSLNAH